MSTESPALLRLSIIICCHNSAARLEPTLRHLSVQSGLQPDRWEVILVDNASSDETATRAAEIWQAAGAPADLRIISEPKLGLSHARAAGIDAALNDIVSFVDDDNWVCPTWCAKILELMTSFSDLDVIGARSQAAFDADQSVPPWFPTLQHGYAIGPQAANSGWIEKPLPRFYGAGLTIRLAALRSLFHRGFSPLLAGRSGNRLTAGEDSELCYALALNGARFWYEASLQLFHFMPPQRLTLQYAQKLFYNLGFTSATEDLYHELVSAHADVGFAQRLKRARVLRYGNSIRRLIKHRLIGLMTTKYSDAWSLARVRENYFMGRLDGLRERRENLTAFTTHIARWAEGVQY